jgi:hypothetical protein
LPVGPRNIQFNLHRTSTRNPPRPTDARKWAPAGAW